MRGLVVTAKKIADMKALNTPLSQRLATRMATALLSAAALAGAGTVLAAKDLAALGEKIYRGGMADRSIPACAACHSPTGAGIPSQYPRVGGQHADYTEAQLLAFRSGARGNSLQMTQIAAKMNDREIKAVSDYINGLR